MQAIIQQFKSAILLLFMMILLTGVIYPAIITGFAKMIFPWKSQGSLIVKGDKKVGSFLIGQSFTERAYFWGRPSATVPFPYNAENSMGSNLGPGNPVLLNLVKLRVLKYKAEAEDPGQEIPIDLVTASASGLDPDISPLAAYYQIPRIAKKRNLKEDVIKKIVDDSIVKRSFFAILGEPHVNVLKLNLALDELQNGR